MLPLLGSGESDAVDHNRSAQEGKRTMDTQAIIQHHLDTLAAGDLEGIMSDYTEESLLIVPGAVLKGLEALRGAFTAALDASFKPGAHTFTLYSLDVDGDCGLITWKVDAEAGDIVFGQDSFCMRAGKIWMQTGAVFTG